MSMDSITETIAHFIGFFQTTLEQARLREAYEKFLTDKAEQLEHDELPLSNTQFDARFDLLDYMPFLSYAPLRPDQIIYYPWAEVTFAPPVVDIPWQKAFFPGWLIPPLSLSAGSMTILPQVEPLGSVVSLFFQKAHLSDNDYFGVGAHKLFFTPAPIDNAALLRFADSALSISPIGVPDVPADASAMGAFIRTTADQFDRHSRENAPEGATVTVERAETLDGKFLNGVVVEELPDLDDYFEIEPDEEPEPETGNAIVHADGTVTVEASVKLEAGGNTLVNSAGVTSFWTAATVTAAMGDHIEINAIVQANAFMDFDAISGLVVPWTHADAATQAFNLASFSRYDTHAELEPVEGEPQFPEHWVVAHVTGDVMIVNWLQQFVFMSDNDVGVLSSTGATTSVIAGENMSVNQISLYEMALAYDLIIVGGHVFDANIIQQMNVLFDNDMIGAVEGFHTTGAGSASTSDNLLWNQASIYNVGGAHRFESMPEAYRAFADSLADGGNGEAGDVLSDTAFAGLGAMRVLYISGDLIKLNYISQTNILGDSDQIALAMDAIGPVADADWTLHTGSNNLINMAAIADLDSLGKTYVGGQQYSQETLIQAEFISASPDGLGARNPDALVNEAVAFLVDDAPNWADSQTLDPSYYPQDAGHSDGLQSMLS